MGTELTKFNQAVFSMKKQSALGTALAGTDIGYSVDLRAPAFANVAPEFKDNAESVNGLEFPTRQDLLAKNSGLSIEVDWDSKLAGFLLALMLQDVTTDQPDAVNDPLAYRHIIIPSALSDGAVALLTTAMLAQTSDILDKLPDLAVSELSFTAEGETMMTGGATLVGSGRILAPDGGYSFPAVEDGSYLWSNQGSVSIGGSTVNTTIKKLEMKVMQEIVLSDFLISTVAADRGVRGRMDFKAPRKLELSAELLLEGGAAERQKLLDSTSMAFSAEFLGDLIPGDDATLRHSLKLEVPKAFYKAFELQDMDGRVGVKVDFLVVDDTTTGYPFRFTVVNEQPWYLTAP